MPGFNGMGISVFVELDVRLYHFLHEPCTVMAAPPGLGTGDNGLFKGIVHGNSKGGVFDFFFQGSGNFDGVRVQYQPRVRRPPQQGLLLGKPGEDTVLIGKQEPFCAEVSSNTEETVGSCKPGRRKFDPF